MTTRSQLGALVAAIALSGATVIGAPPPLAGAQAPAAWPAQPVAPSGATDRQIRQLLERTARDTEKFRRSLERALDRAPIDGPRDQGDINRFVTEFIETMDGLSDQVRRGHVVPGAVEDVLRRGARIDGFMERHQLTTQAENDWLRLRSDLDDLARVHGVAWNWSDPCYAGGESIPAHSRRLTGTYQLERGRGDDAARMAEQATRRLPAAERSSAHRRLMSRLVSPDTIAIDRNDDRVTLASSHGPKVTFEADGRERAEPGAAGSVNTRATLYGDRLVVTTAGHDDRTNDFDVTFEPIDEGRTLRVTRRIYDDGLDRPVTIQSYYRRSSDQAEWTVYAPARNRASGNGATARAMADVPDGTRLVATLDEALSTRDANVEDHFTATVRSPSRLEGAVIEGIVSSVNASGRVAGRADMALTFERIRLRNGRSGQFAGVLESIRTTDGENITVNSEGRVEDASQTTKTVQRGAIGAGIGAIIGAISGGSKGAAIGAVIGAGGGAGTVLIQGRDQIDLSRGAALTIVSGGF